MCQPDSELFGTVVDIRNTELATLWARFNIHLVVNGGLIVMLITTDQSKLGSLSIPSYVFGLFLGVLWLLSERFGRAALKHRDAKVREFEEKYFKNDLQNYMLFRDVPEHLYRHERLSLVLIGLFLLAWLLLFGRAMCQAGYFK